MCICNKKLDLFGFIAPAVLKCLFNATVISQKLIKNGLILTRTVKKYSYYYFTLNTLNSGFEDLKGFKRFYTVSVFEHSFESGFDSHINISFIPLCLYHRRLNTLYEWNV